MRWRIVALILAATVVGCSTPERATDNPERSRLGVLIIAGEGLIPRYDDAEDPRVSATLFLASQKFAESIFSEIERRGTKAQLYVNRDRNVSTKIYVPRLFVSTKRDGLVQVTVTHVKNTTENTIYLSASYNPLQWRKDSSGESFVTGRGPVVKYKLLGDGEDGRNTSLNAFAKEFVDALHRAGYIG